ncbi:MAG: hypothetical protein R6V12_12825, partial [Candidatus Hydrogenedentota bacterium]
MVHFCKQFFHSSAILTVFLALFFFAWAAMAGEEASPPLPEGLDASQDSQQENDQSPGLPEGLEESESSGPGLPEGLGGESPGLSESAGAGPALPEGLGKEAAAEAPEEEAK